ncbi:MAG TPA: DUF1127 domain-containing protein [Salinarimonas sp.]|jgi:uncharacterized protein YjiS (DUF1127 family)|nr:DUF1127 domain-containing protein [Salinarimonas sp.]
MALIISTRAASVAPALRALAAFRAFADGVAREVQVLRDLRALQALDDHRLHDIGLDRGSIEDAVRHGRPRRRG